MLDKSCYELIPFVPILWRGDIRLVPKRVQDVLRRQLSWHETQFDKRPNSIGQQAVVDLVHVGEVIDCVSFSVFSIYAHFVVENGMKPYVLEVSGLFNFTQIAPVTFAQAENGASRAKHLLPKMREGSRRSIRVHRDEFWLGSVLPLGWSDAQNQRHRNNKNNWAMPSM